MTPAPAGLRPPGGLGRRAAVLVAAPVAAIVLVTSVVAASPPAPGSGEQAPDGVDSAEAAATSTVPTTEPADDGTGEPGSDDEPNGDAHGDPSAGTNGDPDAATNGDTTGSAPAVEPATTAPTVTTTTLPPAPAALHVRVGREKIPHIMAALRYLESRDDYDVPPNKANASGAYQFIPRTWGNYGGYPHAYLAPPEVQDERAEIDVRKFLEMWNYDVSMVPVMWYYPAGARNPALMDVIPVPSAGNVLTVREYQTRWMGIFSFISGQPVKPRLSEADRRARAGLPPELPATAGQRPAIAYPVLGPSRVAIPQCDADDAPEEGPDPSLYAAAGLCDEAASAVVFGVQLQPVVAVADGVITSIRDDPGSDEAISVVVTDVTGRSYVHAGFNDDSPGTDDGAAPRHLRLSGLARVGATVHAGQVLGFMGNSEALPLGIRAEVPTDATVSIDPDAVAPHVRISIVEIDGTHVDAFGPLIDALFRQTCTVAIGPWAMPPNGDGHRPRTIETTDNDRTIDSEWVIDERGIVTATGWAAMVNPHDGCPFAPREPHGPGAGGSNDVPLSWLVPIDVPTSVWVRLAADLASVTSPALLRRG